MVQSNTFSDSSKSPFDDVSVKRLTEKFRKISKLTRTLEFNMKLVCPCPINLNGNDKILELCIHQTLINHSRKVAFCLFLHSLHSD